MMWLFRWACRHFRRRVEAMDAYVVAGVMELKREKEGGMVGGLVIETVAAADRVWVNVRDTRHPKDTCAIYVERNADAERIAPGDSLWWQSGFAMWTPAANVTDDHGQLRAGVDYDIQIPRLSYSGVGRPEGHDVLDHEEVAV